VALAPQRNDSAPDLHIRTSRQGQYSSAQRVVRSAHLTAGPCDSLRPNRQRSTACLVGLGRSPVRSAPQRAAPLLPAAVSTPQALIPREGRTLVSGVVHQGSTQFCVPPSRIIKAVSRRNGLAQKYLEKDHAMMLDIDGAYVIYEGVRRLRWTHQ